MARPPPSGGAAAAAEAADPARGAGGAAVAAGCGLGCDGQADGAARRRRGPRRSRAKAAAELGVAPAVAAPAVGGAAASVVGPGEVFLVADGLLRQAADYEHRLSEQLRQMLESAAVRGALGAPMRMVAAVARSAVSAAAFAVAAPPPPAAAAGAGRRAARTAAAAPLAAAGEGAGQAAGAAGAAAGAGLALAPVAAVEAEAADAEMEDFDDAWADGLVRFPDGGAVASAAEARPPPSDGAAAAAEAADPARGAGGAAGAAGCGLGCDGQADGAARRRRGPRCSRAKAAAELGVAPAVAAPAVGGAAASVVGPGEVFLVADGLLRQAVDYEPRLSEQLRQMLESVSWRPELVLGRHAACHVVLEDPRISARHLRICWSGGGKPCYFLEQLGSNGSFVNDHHMKKGDTRTLQHGDAVSVCTHPRDA
ncbi:unnamed protein product, partial [Prorocentrum cordatum]